jgi:hypothetical protein
MNDHVAEKDVTNKPFSRYGNKREPSIAGRPNAVDDIRFRRLPECFPFQAANGGGVGWVFFPNLDHGSLQKFPASHILATFRVFMKKGISASSRNPFEDCDGAEGGI